MTLLVILLVIAGLFIGTWVVIRKQKHETVTYHRDAKRFFFEDLKEKGVDLPDWISTSNHQGFIISLEERTVHKKPFNEKQKTIKISYVGPIRWFWS